MTEVFVQECVVRINWEGPFTLNEIASKHDESDYGLYQIYGHHVVFGPDSLLYVGKAQQQTFARRFEQHSKWLRRESGVSVYLGRLNVEDYKHEPNTWEDWKRVLSDAEALTIYWHSPPYNSHYIVGYTGAPLRLRNEGNRARLLGECASDGTADRPDDAYLRVATFTVDGTPARFAGGPEKWREYCCERAKQELRNMSMPVATPVKLVVRFFVLKTARGHDLDNMLKMTIDALGGAGLFAASKAGGHRTRWNCDDGLVYRIEADKVLVDEQPHTEMEVWVTL